MKTSAPAITEVIVNERSAFAIASDLFKSRLTLLVLLTTLAFGVIGWMDDYRKLIKKDPKGLIARWKYFWQSVCGLAAAIALYAAAQEPAATQLIELGEVQLACRCDGDARVLGHDLVLPA